MEPESAALLRSEDDTKTVMTVLKVGGSYLFLQFAEHKGRFAGLLAFAGGKRENGERAFMAAMREGQEETGIPFTSERLEYLGKFRVDSEKTIVTVFYMEVPNSVPIVLSKEHKSYALLNEEGIRKMVAQGMLHADDQSKQKLDRFTSGTLHIIHTRILNTASPVPGITEIEARTKPERVQSRSRSA